MGLARAAGIDSLEVNCAPGISIGFCCHHHPALPFHWGVHRDSLKHPKPHVPVEAIQDCLLPVERHDARSVHSARAGFRVNMEF